MGPKGGYRFPRRPRHKQPAEIRAGTRGPWLGADPRLSATNKHPGPSGDACEVPASMRSVWALFFFFRLLFLMKQLNRRRAGNLLIAPCQRRSKYPTGTLYSIIGLATQTATLTGNICASFFLRGPFWGFFFFLFPFIAPLFWGIFFS